MRASDVVILLDALNQFDVASHAGGLSWLPVDLPPNARIVLSALPGQALDELRRRPHPPREIELTPLTPADGEAIIEQFLRRYSKRFEPDQRIALLAKIDAGMPLYVLTALEELRTLGTYEAITGRIAELPSTTRALFAWMLARLEDDDGFRDGAGRLVGSELVPRFAAVMGASRFGLSQRELADLLDPGDPHGNVAALLHLLRPCLMRRGELLDFYHGQFREAATDAWLTTDAQRVAAHARLATYFQTQPLRIEHERAATPNLRKLSELPHHLLGCGDLQGLGDLVRSEFLEMKAEAFGEADGVADARRIAEVLAGAGEPCWDDLLRCAWTYCELTERLHARPESLEVLIRRGEVPRVLAAIASEPDESRQAMLRLAASALLADAGHVEVAREMRERAVAVAAPRLGLAATLTGVAPLEELHAYPFELRCLGRALLELPLAPAGPPHPRKPSPSSDPREPVDTPRATVPFKDLCVAYFSDEYRAKVMFWGWVGFLMATGLAIRLYYPHLMPLIQTVTGKVVVVTLFALAAFGPLLLQSFSDLVLQRQPERAHRVIGGLVQAAMHAPVRRQRRILFRALRYLSLLGPAHGGGLWIHRLASVVALRLADASDPRRADLLCEATGASDRMVDAVVDELRKLDPAPLERVLGEAANHPFRLTSKWQFLRIVVGTADLAFDPARLLRFVSASPDATAFAAPEDDIVDRLLKVIGISGSNRTGGVRLEGLGPEVRLLQQVGAPELARAVLAGVRRGAGSLSTEEQLRARAQSILESVRRHAGALRSPMSLAEPLLWGCVMLPPGLGFFLLFAPIAAFVACLIAMIMLLGRTQDAFRMWQWLPQAGSVWPHRERIERTSEEPSFATSETGLARRCGFIPEAMLARAIVTRETIDWSRDSARSEGQRRRVLSGLMRASVLGRRGDVVLATMGNRRLLEAATTIPEKVGRKRPVRALTPNRHERQVTCVLPLASPWRSFGLVLMLSLPATLAWVRMAGGLRAVDAGMQGIRFTLFALGYVRVPRVSCSTSAGYPGPVFRTTSMSGSGSKELSRSSPASS